MIYSGTDLKYKVTATWDGFDMSMDDFSLSIENRFGIVVSTIAKEDMFIGTDSNYYFVIEGLKSGIYYAQFTAGKSDTDYSDSVQHVVNRQFLVAIGTEYTEDGSDSTDGLTVVYERVWTVSVNGEIYLTDSEGNYITDVNGNYIILTRTGTETSSFVRLSMTGDQIKELLEGTNSDGKINTIPEVMEAMSGFSDDTSYGISTEENISDMMDEILNS